jgi:hypothetical protein
MIDLVQLHPSQGAKHGAPMPYLPPLQGGIQGG